MSYFGYKIAGLMYYSQMILVLCA